MELLSSKLFAQDTPVSKLRKIKQTFCCSIFAVTEGFVISLFITYKDRIMKNNELWKDMWKPIL